MAMTHAERSVVTTDDGAALAVWTSGPIDGTPVLLVHGFSLDHTTWNPLADVLVGSGHRVLVPDLRGHGESTLGHSNPTPERFVADLETVIAELATRRVHVVGHSFGAVIALAARANAAVAHLLVSVTAIAGSEASIQNPVMRLGARLFSSRAGVWLLGKRRTGRVMISTWFGKRPRVEDLDWIRNVSASCSHQTRQLIGETTADLDLRPTFRQPGPPTLVMCGRQDKATPLKFSRRIASAIAGAELAIVDDAGHMVIIERPAVVARHLAAWFVHSA